ncbi:MAG TPA: beta-ketoacyl synthase N-terminal-like domain-containing protein [Ktedonobacteraceae bacterium]|nr:beta-ketoacyl synthase N-terminal-like domain-containing protein [Ktedonobacteraceae bacterium]
MAIVSMSCRFPGAENLNELWQILSEGYLQAKSAPGDQFERRADQQREARVMCVPDLASFSLAE